MPTVPKGDLILITSGSGFVAMWIIEHALRQGYKVRTTVRSHSKGEYIKQTFERKHGVGAVEYVLVPDMAVEGAYDQAVQAVSAVIHTSSPVHFDSSKDAYQTLINPAVQGINSILHSVLNHGTNVQRFVLTSSNSAVSDFSAPPGTIFHVDNDWNTADAQLVASDPIKYAGAPAYRASKVLSERAAWDFWEKHLPSWDLISICPVFVFGPPLQQATPDSLNETTRWQYNLLQGKLSPDEYHTLKGGHVDVRDVAAIHIKSLFTEGATGRFPATAHGSWVWQDYVDAVHDSHVVDEAVKARVPAGQHGSGIGIIQRQLDPTKSERVLGIKWHSVQDQVDAQAIAFADYEKRGWTGLPSLELLNL